MPDRKGEEIKPIYKSVHNITFMATKKGRGSRAGEKSSGRH